MTRIRLAALLALSLGTPALAATAAPTGAPSTGPALVRHVTPLGTTKPDGAALDARGGTRPDLDRRSRALDRLIATSICKGC